MDGDGLYDAYCCIWASDALEYSGGGVTHSSAYNYRANRIAAELAVLIGEDPAPYRAEADKILRAMNTRLWMPEKGCYAEYVDRGAAGANAPAGGTAATAAGLHPAAGLWTIYHAIDSRVPDPFQAWQSLHYIDTDIPHIPVRAVGLKDTGLYTLSTTNWQPYSWSLNNVVLAESLHTALAYWQGGRPETAWPLWKGALVESMFLGASPGNFQQISSYDAMRGELYRDFADPIGMAARSLVEGLFGIRPDALHDTLTIQPGWPLTWGHASLHVPDIGIEYVQQGSKDRYVITPAFGGKMNLCLKLKARAAVVLSVMVNGRAVSWTNAGDAVGGPSLQVIAAPAAAYRVEIVWGAAPPDQPRRAVVCVEGERLVLPTGKTESLGIYDPQQVLSDAGFSSHVLHGAVRKGTGKKVLFVHLRQGRFSWWAPVEVTVISPVEITIKNGVWLTNHSPVVQKGRLVLNDGSSIAVDVPVGSVASRVSLPDGWMQPGRNVVRYEGDKGGSTEQSLTDWTVSRHPEAKYDTIDLTHWYNDGVTHIFKNQYLSPRPASPTLQLPTQGIGNWCYPLITAEIDDAGLRKVAGERNEIFLPDGIPLATPGGADPGAAVREGTGPGAKVGGRNIVFTSHWDNYPDSVAIPLSGRAGHAYFMLAGTTNPMQSRITNGIIEIRYKDGSMDELELINPSTWWPIEQDYYDDGFAFTTGAPRPFRVYLKTGQISDRRGVWTPIKGFTDTGIDGGAATILDMPLHPGKELDRIVLRTVANDVVIGLMSLTLLRN